jgi:hypothetical protein
VSRWAGVAWVVCAACGTADARDDAGVDAASAFDSARDVGGDAPADARPDAPDAEAPWEHPWNVALGELHAHSTEPCPDWEPHQATLPRGLPTDAEVRPLWGFALNDDPLGAGGRGSPSITLPSLMPDGRTLLVFGPDIYDRTIAAIRDGRVVARMNGVAVASTAPFVIAPDGTAYQRGGGDSTDCGPTPCGELILGIRLTEDDRFETWEYRLRTGSRVGRLIAAPGGRLLTNQQPSGEASATITAVCRTGGVLWERDLHTRPGRGVGYDFVVDGNSTLRVRFTGSRRDQFGNSAGEHQAFTWLFDLNGEFLESIPPAPLDAERSEHAEVGVLDGNSVATREVVGSGPTFYRSESTSIEAAPPMGREYPFSFVQLAVDGGFWAMERAAPGRMERWLGSERHTFENLWLPYYPSDTGSMLFHVREEEAPPWPPIVEHVEPSGEISWRYESERFGNGQPLLANDGVMFFVGSLVVTAIQTPMLPPPPDSCLVDGCNAQRDGWVRPVPSEPATLRR